MLAAVLLSAFDRRADPGVGVHPLRVDQLRRHGAGRWRCDHPLDLPIPSNVDDQGVDIGDSGPSESPVGAEGGLTG